MRNVVILGCVSVAAIFAASAAMAQEGSENLEQMSMNPKNWVMQSGNYANWRYSPLKQINTENVKDLVPAWTFSTGVLRGHEGGPLVIGDVMYLVTPFPNIVYALDLNHPGKILWKYEPKQNPAVISVMCCDTVNRGIEYADGKIILHQADTTVAAIDAKTGKLLWSVKNGDPKKGETGTMAPLIVKNMVLVGDSGGEFGVHGDITAYNLDTGKRIWRAYNTGPDDMIKFDPDKTMSLGKPVGKNSSLESWKGDQWKIGGATVWGWISYDPKLNLIYYGTSNPGTWNPTQRPGDNRWSCSVIARDADTGEAKWVYQFTPHDQWDYDGINEMVLANLDIDGKETPVLMHPDRNGFLYVINRENGEPISATKYGPVNWATKIDLDKSSKNYGRPEKVAKYSPGDRGTNVNYTGICPAALGTKDQQPSSWDPETKVLYVPTNHVCMDYEPFRVSYTAGQPYVGATLSMYPPEGQTNMGAFIAFDPVKQKILWSNPERFSVWSGALSTGGGLVFYGTLEGYLKAVDAKTGKTLYEFKTPSGIIGNVMAYEHNGREYVAVLSGVGGWAGIGLAAGLTNPHAGLGAVGGYAALSNYTALGGQLTVFALPASYSGSGNQ